MLSLLGVSCVLKVTIVLIKILAHGFDFWRFPVAGICHSGLVGRGATHLPILSQLRCYIGNLCRQVLLMSVILVVPFKTHIMSLPRRLGHIFCVWSLAILSVRENTHPFYFVWNKLKIK